MGVGEAFGVKVEKLSLAGLYDIESLYEKIKDASFEAGEPKLVKHGFAKVIAFPQLDKNNQVWILESGKGKFVVERSTTPAGLGNTLGSMAMDDMSKAVLGIEVTGLSGAFGATKKRCMELVEKTAQTINGMNL